MIRADRELEQMFREFFAGEVSAGLVDHVERSGNWPSELWAHADRTELPSIGIPESSGGVGGSLADVAAMIEQAAYHATPLPLLEHHLATYLLASVGLDQIDGPLTITGLGTEPSPPVTGTQMTGVLGPVPWAQSAAAIAVLTTDENGQDAVAVVRPEHATFKAGHDLAGVPTPTVTLQDAPVLAGVVLDLDSFRLRAEVLRCSALTGLLHRLYDMTSGYVSERHQFGKPISAFQAVQIHIVTLAQSASMASVSTDRAVSAVASGGGRFECASTVVVVEECATRAVTAAHQAHGAIGMTREYPLQQITRRVHATRQAWQPVSAVAASLGETAHAAGSLAALVASHPQEGIMIG
jgi:acyl-CoA dehydrogenase